MTANNKYSKFEISKVKEGDIRRVIPGCDPTKSSQEIDCPNCGKKKFSVVHKKGLNMASCWSCDFRLSNPIEAYAHFHNLDVKRDYIQVVEGTATQCGITLTPESRKREISVATEKKTTASSFCQKQLAASGLVIEDVFANVIEKGQEMYRPTFRRGRFSEQFTVDESGDDMLIYYYRLDGTPMEYIPKGRSAPRQLVRVRWANPDLHRSSDGKPMKYQSPPGAPASAYIPEIIRAAYRNKTQIETLFLQEGEKKAEKACKHGIMSIGIQGINNFGSAASGLIQEIQDIVVVCGVKNVVLVMDSDWNNLHSNITIGDRADKRPNSFSKAVIKFQQYLRTFQNLNISVDAWWGHVNENPNGDKGVDDLLVGSLLGHEDELLTDITRTMNSHDGKGKWLDIYRISSYTEAKIQDFWLLNDAQAFYSLHKEALAGVANFKIRNMRYKVEDGKLLPVSRYSSSSDIYSITQTSKGEDRVEFDDVEAFRFLSGNGFYRCLLDEEDSSAFEFVRIDGGIVDKVPAFAIRDFVQDYILTNCKSHLVQLFFYRKLATILSDKQLERLPLRSDNFNNFEPGVQRTYYNNGQVEITEKGITPGLPIEGVWRSRIIARDFARREVIKNITFRDGHFEIEYAPGAENCDFLMYLVNTSNNYYQFGGERELTPDETHEWAHHIVNKLTTIGYLLTDYKYSSERKAVVVQDHQLSEVGQSHGGVGKSLLGDAIGRVTKQFFIDGKMVNLGDEFLLDGVTRTTRTIFFDDIKVNFDFEKLFTMVTGQMPVNPKGGKRFTIPLEDSPKILINTNHAINKASEPSFRRRIAYIEFSNWYNPDHTPINDFHRMLFDDWDEVQWQMFDNVMAECVMYYLRSRSEGWAAEGCGAVAPPMRNVELRTLRQEMGEVFLAWAEEYFDPTGDKLNERVDRKDIWLSFAEYAGASGSHGVTRTNIRKKIEKYCSYKGYDFNITKQNKDKMYYADWKPQHPDELFFGGDDKSGGKEYITVYSPDLEKEKKPF